MNLGQFIGLDRSEHIVLQSKYKKTIVFLGNTLEDGGYLLIEKENVPYIENMLLKHEYRLYAIRREPREHQQTDRRAVVKFCDLPRTVRDEIRQKAPDTGAEDVFSVLEYGE